jgi:5-methylcytosine-specific restriction endonuclease McrA
MIELFKKLIRKIILSKEEMEILSLPRSSEWKKLRKIHLGNFPCCEVCGSKTNVVPHHVIPFHVNPALELDPSNLITLCESKTFNCHLFFGHLKNWIRHNPNVREDAKLWREKTNDL